MTLSSAARHYGYTRQHFLRLAKQGKLPDVILVRPHENAWWQVKMKTSPRNPTAQELTTKP